MVNNYDDGDNDDVDDRNDDGIDRPTFKPLKMTFSLIGRTGTGRVIDIYS